jgi:hypothetical protein
LIDSLLSRSNQAGHLRLTAIFTIVVERNTGSMMKKGIAKEKRCLAAVN